MLQIMEPKLREVLGDHPLTDFGHGVVAFSKWVEGEEIDRASAQSYLRSLNGMSASGLLKGAH